MEAIVLMLKGNEALEPVRGVPFIAYTLNLLIKNGVRKFIFAVSNSSSQAVAHLGFEYKGVPIDYAFADSPCTTGGAIKKALVFCREEQVVIAEAGVYCDINLAEMLAFHREQARPITLCAKSVKNPDGYAGVEIRNSRVKGFTVPGTAPSAKINTGVYIINRTALDSIGKTEFSFENDVLQGGEMHISAFEANGVFVDLKSRADLPPKIRARAAFLDRDGTINREINHLSQPSAFSFIYGTPQAIDALHRRGYLVIVLTNQAGVAKGYYDEAAVNRLHRYIDGKLAENAAYVDGWYYCPHHPAAAVEKYRIECNCRKPATGMIDRALADFAEKGIEINLAESLLIGDTENDILTGKNAGIGKTVLVRTGHPADEAASAADCIADSLYSYTQTM